MSNWVMDLVAWSVPAFGALLFAAQVLAREAGYRLGRRRAAEGAAEAPGAGLLVGALLGLLAFVLALTLSFSNARYSERREGALAEANAIGTAWLRAQAIDHPRAAEIARLLEGYTELRLAFVRADFDPPLVAGLTERTNARQSEIWGHLTALVRERPDPVTAALMAALNETFDRATAERAAFALRMPPGLFWLLIGLAMAGIFGIGYQIGLSGRPHRMLSSLLILTWTVVIVQILDLGAPRLGSVRTGTDVYVWTLEGFRGGVTIPPLPPPR